MTEHGPLVFRFDDVEVRQREFLLIKAGEALPVEPKAFRVLLFLLNNPGRLVTKDEIIGAVWNDCAVSDNSLTRSIATLRRLLGDDTHEPRYIATVPTVGYRFLCDVTVMTDGFSAPVSSHTAEEDGGGHHFHARLAGTATTAVGIESPASPVPTASPVETSAGGASASKLFRWRQVFFMAISLVAVSAGVFWFFHRRLTTNQPRVELRVTSNSPEAPIRSAVISPDG